MQCSRCGAFVAEEASYCARCGTPIGGSAGLGSMQHREEAAHEAFKRGDDPAGVQCPNCGAYRMQAVRIDADATMAFGAIFFIVGIVTAALVLFFGDAGLYVADASMLALTLVIAGAVLLIISRYRRRARAFECFACGYRVS